MSKSIENSKRTKSIESLKTVEDFENALNDLLGDFSVAVRRIGEMVKRASHVLTNEDYNDLTRRLKDRGWTESLFEGARDVAEGKLLPELVVVNVPISKVRALPLTDQKRLVKGEKFLLKQNEGPPLEKAWKEMSGEEQNQLLGPKGGHIHTPREQKVAAAAKKQIDFTNYTEARYDRHEGKFRFSYSRKAGEITLGAMIASLLDKGELEAANDAWQAKIEELRELVASGS